MPNENGQVINTSNPVLAAPGSNAMDRCVCLQVSLSALGTKKKVATGAVQVDADKTFVHVSKDILKSDRLEAVRKCDGEIRTFINTKCLPSIFKAGVYLLPIALVESVDARLEEFREIRTARINLFLEEYQDVKAAAQGRLGVLFNETDYPSTDQVRAMFSMTTRYLTFATPGTLANISKELFAREVEKQQAMVANQFEEIQAVLRAGFGELVDHLVDRLTPDPTGKQKIFRDSLIKNVKEFFADFNARNVVDDQELAALVDKARQILDGVSPELLRDHKNAREVVRDEMAQVKAALDSMMQNAPGRKIDFTAED